MRQTIIVLSITIGASLLLTAFSIWISPNLLSSSGGIFAIFSAIFLAIMGLGGGTIKGWVETFFEKKEKNQSKINVKDSFVIDYVENFYNHPNSSVGVDKLEEKSAEKQEIVLSRNEAQLAYLSAIIADFRPLSLSGMDIHSGDVKAKLSLEDIYISLNTTTLIAKEVKGKSGRDDTRPLTVLEAFIQAPECRVVLLGAPGTGKSTFVRYLSLQLAKQLNGSSMEILENWVGKPLLPIAISLGRLAESLALDSKIGTAEMIEKFIVSTLEADERTKFFAQYVLPILGEDGGLIFFDGLDEVASLELRPMIVQSIESFTEKYSRNKLSRFLVTCRVFSYQDTRWKLAGWPVYEIALFSQQQIKRLIELWYDLHTFLEPGRAIEFNVKKRKLLAAVQIDDPRRLYEVACYPIILTMMAIVHASYDLPDSRARVYEQCVELLLDKWQSRRSIKNKAEFRSLTEELNVPASAIYEPLYEIAFEAHKAHKVGKYNTGESGSLITEGLIDGILHDYLQDRNKVDVFLEYCKNANGLLMLRGVVTLAGSNVARNEYVFPHPTFEEFLASRHLRNLDPEDVRLLLDTSYDRWREPIKFMAELFCFSKEPNRNAMNGLLEALSSPFPENPDGKDWRAIWLAGELLIFYNRVWKEKKKSSYEKNIVTNLRKMVETAQLTPRERADVADILEQLFMPNDLFEFTPVLEPKIFITKYPVTNLQYERFLRENNFINKDLWCNFLKFDENNEIVNENWDNEPWKWLQNALNIKNYDIQDGVLLPRFWHDSRFGIAHPYAPVVGISWYEANAYCNWVLMNWNDLEEGNQFLVQPNLIRLPLDKEWTLAAGGDENGRFAFGEVKKIEELSRLANIRESDINHPTPVWMYPQGASPTGALDLSGNIWEWQANYSDKKYLSQRALSIRGGSYLGDKENARVSVHNGYLPGDRYNFIGFRVVASFDE